MQTRKKYENDYDVLTMYYDDEKFIPITFKFLNLHLLGVALDKDRDGSDVLNINDKPVFSRRMTQN